MEEHHPAGCRSGGVVAAVAEPVVDTDHSVDSFDEPDRERHERLELQLVLLLNTADDPVIERILTPRITLTVAEHLADGLGYHVLVVAADMTS